MFENLTVAVGLGGCPRIEEQLAGAAGLILVRTMKKVKNNVNKKPRDLLLAYINVLRQVVFKGEICTWLEPKK